MNKRLKSIILLASILILAGFVIGCNDSNNDEETQGDNYIPVEVEIAKKDAISNKININGRVVANKEVMVLPKAMGIVTNINVNLGDMVKEGDILFTIEKDDIEKGVAQAANAVELAKKGVAQAENGLNMARINYELSSEKIENALLNLERMRRLYEEGAVSKSQLEQAELSANEKGMDALSGQVTQAELSYGQALNQLTQAEIAYEQAITGLEHTNVTAPVDGMVSLLDVKVGQIATNNQPAAIIVDIDKLYIQISVVENILNKLEVGQKVDIKVPSALDEYFSSTIDFISPTADMRSQLYNVRISIENIDGKIKPGMNSEVVLSTEQVDKAVVIKSNAVIDKEDRNIVYVIEEGKAVEKEVITGLDTGKYVEIKSGIKEGEKIIIEGQHFVEDNQDVKVVRGE